MASDSMNGLMDAVYGRYRGLTLSAGASDVVERIWSIDSFARDVCDRWDEEATWIEAHLHALQTFSGEATPDVATEGSESGSAGRDELATEKRQRASVPETTRRGRGNTREDGLARERRESARESEPTAVAAKSAKLAEEPFESTEVSAGGSAGLDSAAPTRERAKASRARLDETRRRQSRRPSEVFQDGWEGHETRPPDGVDETVRARAASAETESEWRVGVGDDLEILDRLLGPLPAHGAPPEADASTRRPAGGHHDDNSRAALSPRGTGGCPTDGRLRRDPDRGAPWDALPSLQQPSEPAGDHERQRHAEESEWGERGF